MKYPLGTLFVIVVLFCSIPGILDAQDLTGIWRGHFRSNVDYGRLSGGYDDRYKIEVQIAQKKNQFQAVTFSYKNTEFFGKADATGTLNPKTKKVLLKESKITEVRMAKGDVFVMTCFLQYTKLGSDEYLQGTYYSTNARDTLIGGDKGSIFLHRVSNTDFQKEPMLEKREKELLALKIPELSKKPATTPVIAEAKPKPDKKLNSVPKSAPPSNSIPQPKSINTIPEAQTNLQDEPHNIIQPSIPTTLPLVISSRKNELLKTFTVNNNQIELRIYDDGAIDNDSVSVYYDNQLIVSKAKLTDQPIIAKINVTSSTHPHQLVMVAENLGEIPPNTSLLIVYDGDKRYEQRISSNEQKNVVINFIYKKIE